MKNAAMCLLAIALQLGCGHARGVTEPALLTEIGAAPDAAIPAQTAQLRIVTYNVHFGRDVSRIAAQLHENPRTGRADILLLQEIRSYVREGTSRAHRLAERLGMAYVYAPAHRTDDGGTHGLAVLSRLQLRDPQVLELPPFKIGGAIERRIALRVHVEVAGQPVRIYNVHLDTRLDPADRLAQLAPLLADAADQERVLLGGDFNTNPFRWLRRTLPIGCSAQPQALDLAMQHAGYATPTAAFASTVTTRLLKMRLDAIYVRGLSAGAAGVEREVVASDHLPMWLDVWLDASKVPAVAR